MSCRMVRRLMVSLSAIAFLALLFSSASLSAQTEQTTSLDSPLGVETVDVEVVNIEVYVTDDEGRTVDGLTKDDFRLFIDHQPVETTNFYRASGSPGDAPATTESGEAVGQLATRAVSGPSDSARRTAANPSAPSPWTPKPGAWEPLTLVLYVDHLQLTEGGRRSYLSQIREFLSAQLATGDQLMVVSHDKGLVVEERFTGDFETLEATLEDLWQAPAGAGEYSRQYDQALDQLENILLTTPLERDEEAAGGAGGGAGGSGLAALAAIVNDNSDPCSRYDRMLDVAESYGRWVASQVERSIANLEELTRALGALPGRKAVLYLSNGLDQNPGLDLQHQVAELCPAIVFQTVGAEMGTRISDATYRLSSLANSRQVTFYTLDASRLQAGGSATARGKLEAGGRSFDMRPSATIEIQRRQSRQATLQTLALETGGLSVLHANELAADLERIEDSLRNYYSLGFEPRDPSPGTSHLVKVELTEPRKGYTLHYRRTYVEQEPVDESRALLLSALLLGYEDNPLGVDIEIGQAEVSETGLPTLPLRIAVPFGSLGWLEHGAQRTGEVELFIAVQSGEGEDQKIDMRSKKIPFRIQEDLWSEARDQSHTLEIGLPVPSLDARLAFAVADLVGQRTSYFSR